MVYLYDKSGKEIVSIFVQVEYAHYIILYLILRILDVLSSLWPNLMGQQIEKATFLFNFSPNPPSSFKIGTPYLLPTKLLCLSEKFFYKWIAKVH